MNTEVEGQFIKDTRLLMENLGDWSFGLAAIITAVIATQTLRRRIRRIYSS